MVTIKDLAAYTGVSATTISNVIHGKSGRVSAETVEKVNAAIKELGYTPNMSARSLVSRSSRVVAFINHVVTRDNSNMMEDPFLSSSIGVIESVLRKNDYYLMLRTVRTEEELSNFLRNWNVDGLFLTGIFHDSFYDSLSSYTIPTVLIDSYVRQKNIYNVGLEDFRGSYLATSYLIENGHRRIGYASPFMKDGGVLQERFLGYKSALMEHNIPFDTDLLFEYEMDTVESCRAAAAAIASHRDVTAVAAAADRLAIGIMSGLHALGIRVPEDLSLVGFDDIQMSQMVIPPLTTIHQDMFEKAQTAVHIMLELLQGNEPASSNVILPVSLTERNSVRKL